MALLTKNETRLVLGPSGCLHENVLSAIRMLGAFSYTDRCFGHATVDKEGEFQFQELSDGCGSSAFLAEDLTLLAKFVLSVEEGTGGVL